MVMLMHKRSHLTTQLLNQFTDATLLGMVMHKWSCAFLPVWEIGESEGRRFESGPRIF